MLKVPLAWVAYVDHATFANEGCGLLTWMLAGVTHTSLSLVSSQESRWSEGPYKSWLIGAGVIIAKTPTLKKKKKDANPVR